MKTKLKARRMWANYYADDKVPHLHPSREDAHSWADVDAATTPVAVIPLDDVEALVKTARKAYYAEGPDYRGNGIRAALTAIGVLPKKRKGRK